MENSEINKSTKTPNNKLIRIVGVALVLIIIGLTWLLFEQKTIVEKEQIPIKRSEFLSFINKYSPVLLLFASIIFVKIFFWSALVFGKPP